MVYKTLEKHNSDKYYMCRIPGVIVTDKKSIVCYYEGRSSSSDWADIDIVMKKSTDGGKTFSDRKILAKCREGETLNNPVMIADDGKIHFLYVSNYEKCYYCVSSDDGETFSAPREITNELCGFDSTFPWNVIALGPGHGIVCEDKRLIIPVWVANGADKGDGHSREHHPSKAGYIESTDGGKTWHTGSLFEVSEEIKNPNETSCAYIGDSKVLFNVRNESEEYLRGECVLDISSGEMTDVKLNEALPDPICFAGMCSFEKDGQYTLYFSNCNPSEKTWKRREFLTVRKSADKGKSWSDGTVIEKLSGYSDINVSADGENIYCFFERQHSDESYELDLVFCTMTPDEIK